MSSPSEARSPHGLFIQLIPQYFRIEGDTERLLFTAEGLSYYAYWYSRYGFAFAASDLRLSELKLDLLRMLSGDLDEESGHLQQSARKVGGIEARVAKELLQANFSEAKALVGLLSQARRDKVVILPKFKPQRAAD